MRGEYKCRISEMHLKLRVQDLKRFGKKTKNQWRLDSMLLNNQWITKEIKKDIKKKYLEINEKKKKKRSIQNLWNATKVVLRRKFIVI